MYIYSITFKTNRVIDNCPRIYYDYYYRSVDWNKPVYLLAGEYKYQILNQEGTVMLDKNTVIESTVYELTVNVMDSDGKIVPNEEVYLNHEKFKDNEVNFLQQTDDNGVATFYVLPGENTISWLNTYLDVDLVTEKRNVNSDTQVTLTIPAKITFTIVDPMHDLTYLQIYKDDDLWATTGNDGEYRGNGSRTCTKRLFPSQGYNIRHDGNSREIWRVKGTTPITDGCTVTIGQLSVSSQGNGLAFPIDSWEDVAKFNVFVGSTIRLSAVPVGNDKFLKWVIDGKEYTDAMMDFKITSPNTTAQAIFGSEQTVAARSLQTNTSLEFNDSYITLPGDMEGVARIFTLDGKQVKQMGVVGDQIGIYDLPKGAYIVSFQHDGGVINAQFLKE